MEHGPIVLSTRFAVPVRDGTIRDTLASGRSLLSSGVWLLRHYGRFQHALQRCCPDVCRLAPIRCAAWHRGARYFRVGLAAGGDCFVKTDGDARLLEREVAAAQRLERTPQASEYTPRLLFRELTGPYAFAGFRWIEHIPLGTALGRPDFGRVAARLADDLLRIVEVLEAAQIVHRDITPENLLVGLDSTHSLSERLTLIDFAFAVLDGVATADARVPAADLDVLGAGFSPAPGVWDDAYSCLRILALMGEAAGDRFAATVRQLRDRVGRRVYRHAVAPVAGRVAPGTNG